MDEIRVRIIEKHADDPEDYFRMEGTKQEIRLFIPADLINIYDDRDFHSFYFVVGLYSLKVEVLP